jgi:diacylglycerol kinase family enzyme
MNTVHHLLNPSGPYATWVKTLTEGTTRMAPWTWISREHPRHTETVLDWALKESVSRLVVWGGDGTFHRVVRGLRERGALDRMELALVPAGTCNDLARRLQLSKYFWRRWEAPSPQGRLAHLALGRLACTDEHGNVTEEIFVNNAGFGRPRTSFERKDSVWGVLKSFQPVPFLARWDGRESRGSCFMALACNAPYFSGGLHFEKDVSPEKGELNVYFVPVSSKAGLAARLVLGRLGRPLPFQAREKAQTSRITIETEVPVWPQADGEPPPDRGAKRVVFETLPERVRVWCPDR